MCYRRQLWQPIFFVHLLCSSAHAAPRALLTHATQQLGDRLLLQVNFKVFTQRQLEIYLGIQTALLSKPLSFSSITAENWRQNLELFRDEMVIAAEAGKQERVEADATNQTELTVALRTLQDSTANNFAFRSFCERLAITSEETRQVVSEILTSANFREKKKIDASWLKETIKRNQVHFFEGSKEYRQIFPPQGKK